ncbi:PREDICTED: alpha- and gamma-adaptin-binding protein p34 isoform X2 [Haliaeetus leucocephalus]|uniref:alpha- and gamma-adaptin-binding protein p34 isoform X2 n=1 Tax=Haliaeetus leucocephalus TaxID=52644 RepID=UPI000522CCB5|nr:PREDICTED: alpha- and gamma-adaptin-binding protein p34 isoform X2 [Haliaeetus albicilla]XP_010570409.1 PREDICTED: alpha- and gamma-adaptin-binding protein p34 isoform X2 [Haliaeetus leucocephalus]
MILVCNRVSENGVNRQKAQEWCIKHGFELVELSPEELPDDDDDFPESTGVKRIVQALNANVWSNVVMKSDRTQGFGLLSTLAGANCSIGSEENQDTESNPSPADREESHVDNREDGASTNSIQNDNIVDKAATLPHEQRKLHAEKVAKAFWMAIGGDRDEIEGLSSDEEN